MSSVNQIYADAKVLMVVMNSVVHDSRVLREANSLISSGYKVKIIGLREQEDESPKSNIQAELIHVWSRNILPKNIFGWLVKYFEFCVKVIIRIIQSKTGIVHAHDLNTFLPAYIGCFFPCEFVM